MLQGSNSVMCKNLNKVAHFFKVDRLKLVETAENNIITNIVKEYVDGLYTENDKRDIGNIKDLLCIRDVNTTMFSRNEINIMLKYLCTS